MVTIQPSASLALATGTTFEAWVRPTGTNSRWRSVMFKDQPQELVYALYANSDRGRPAGIAYTGGAERTAYGSSAVPTSTWTYLAVTHDGTNARLYVNGTLVSTVPTPGTKPTVNGSLRIGGNGVWKEWFKGQIDDVRVYDRALTAAEIGSDLTTAVGGAPAPPAGDTISPSAPANLAASNPTQNSVTVAWSAATDNVGVAGYGLYRDGNSTGSTTSTSTTFTGLACGTSYTFAVDAVDNAGNRSAKASITAATAACPPAPDTQAPTAPSSRRRDGLFFGDQRVDSAGHAASDNVGVAGYGLYRNGTATSSTILTSTSFTGLACGTSYTFAVDAFDDAGNRSAKTSVTASTAACPPDTQAPTAPGSVFVTGSSTTGVSLSWNASFDNVAVTGYGLYRNGTLVATSGTTSATFGGLTCGTSYTLAIDAYDAAGNRSAKASITAATAACPPAPDTQAPTAPGNVSVTGSSTTSVSLGWNAASDNVGVTGYGLYRDGTLTGTGTSTSTTFGGLTCGTSYTLAIDAYDAAGNRSAKASISAATAACSTPPPPPTGSANVYVSPGGSDSTCVRSDSSKPCASFNKAFSIAQSGDLVQVAAGAYGSQSISQSTKTAAVTVRPAAGATVTVASLSVSASHFHIEGIVAAGSGQSRGDLSICSSECNPGLVDVLIKDGGFRSAFIRASGVTVQGGDYGGFDACNSNAPEDGFRFWGGSARRAADERRPGRRHDPRRHVRVAEHLPGHVARRLPRRLHAEPGRSEHHDPQLDVLQLPHLRHPDGAVLGRHHRQRHDREQLLRTDRMLQLGRARHNGKRSELLLARHSLQRPLQHAEPRRLCVRDKRRAGVRQRVPELRLVLERGVRSQRLLRLGRVDVRHRGEAMHTRMGEHAAVEHRWGSRMLICLRRTPAQRAPATRVATRPPTWMVSPARRARRHPTQERTRSASSRESESVVTALPPRPRPHRRLV